MSKILPRYLYHVTTKSNYEKIVSTGKLVPKKEKLAGNAIFMFELQNLFKRWKGSKFNKKCTKLRDTIINFLDKDKSGFVLLKIPTSILNPEILRVRSVQELFKEDLRLENLFTKKYSEYYEKLGNYLFKQYNKLKKQGYAGKELQDMEVEMKRKFIEKSKPPTIEQVIEEYGNVKYTVGENAKKRKLYQQRKDSIEYIYPEEISIENIEKIGECDVDTSFQKVFAELLKNTPEEKALSHHS